MSTCSQSSLEMCDFVPNIPSVYNVTHPFFFNVGQILNCILYCSTAFKVLKNPLQKKLKKCLKGGVSPNFRQSLKFYAFLFNLSLTNIGG